MAVIKKLKKKAAMEDLILGHQRFREPFEIMGRGQYRFVCQVYDQETHADIALKIPLVKDAEKEVRNSYNVKRRIGDHPRLAPLIGDQPFKIGDYWAVLSQFTEFGNAEDHIEHLDEVDVKNLTLRAAEGLQVLHGIGLNHCDVKPSNILIFGNNPGRDARIGDYGTVTRKEATSSARTNEKQYSPEIARAKFNGTLFEYTQGEDIFQLGVTLFMLATGELDGFLPATSKAGGVDNFYDAIKAFIFSKKYQDPEIPEIIYRMTARPVPKNGKRQSGIVYRFQHMDHVISALQGKGVGYEEIQMNHPDYITFKKRMDTLDSAVSEMESKKNGPFGVTYHPVIDKAYDASQAVLAMLKNKHVKNVPEGIERSQVLLDRYDEQVVSDQVKLEGKIAELDRLSASEFNSFMSSHYGAGPDQQMQKFFQPMMKTIYLFGPPMTNKRKAGSKTKDRYSLAEIDRNEKAFYDAVVVPNAE